MKILEQLKGTSWSLVAYHSESIDGERLEPLGIDAIGTIIFTEVGHTAVQMMAKDRTKELGPAVLARYRSEAEKEIARFGYHAYSGPFTISEEESTLTTHVTMSILSEYVGSKQTRKVSIEGDILRLSNIKHPERKIVWQKIQ